MAHTAHLRSFLYAGLSQGFTEPPRRLEDWHRQTYVVGELAAAVEALPEAGVLAAALRALHHASSRVQTTKELEDLHDSYVGIFGHRRPESIPPYETEFTAGGDFRQNQDLADLMGFYRAFGLDLGSGDKLRERPDHIAVELEFLHFLCWKEARARAEDNQDHINICLDAERKFLRDHLGRWADIFARGVERAASHDYFTSLTGLLRALVAREATTFGIALNPVSTPPSPRRAELEPITCGAESLVQIGGARE